MNPLIHDINEPPRYLGSYDGGPGGGCSLPNCLCFETQFANMMPLLNA